MKGDRPVTFFFAVLAILWVLSAVSQCGYPRVPAADCDPAHPGSYGADNGWGKVMCVWP